MDKTIIITSAGSSTQSRYGVKALNPIAPERITRIGVKQHSATRTVPVKAAITFFFEV